MAFNPRSPAPLRRRTAMLRRAIVLPIAIATTVMLTSCAPMPVADDEGHASFAREAIKLLLGRPARNTSEVEATADVAKLLGRNAAAKMLMKETEYVDTWTAVLMELLQIQREGGSQLAGQDKKCWGAPTRANPDPAIAQWVRDHGPTDAGAPTPEWNMTDLLRSAVYIDNLAPVVSAYLFPLSMRRADYVDWQDWSARDQLVQRFLKTYLNRNLTCLGCHNPTFSASNKTNSSGVVVWQRLFSLVGNAEKAVFGDYLDAGTVGNNIHSIMRGDVRKPTFPTDQQFGIQPWGMAKDCARDTADDSPENSPASWQHTLNPPPLPFPGVYPNVYRYSGFQIPPWSTESNTTANFGSLHSSATNDKISLWGLEGALRAGIAGLTNGYSRTTPNTSTLPGTLQLFCDVNDVLLTNGCKSCHGTSGGMNVATPDPGIQLVNVPVTSGNSIATNKRVVPFDVNTSELWRRVTTSNTAVNMPPGTSVVSAADIQKIQNWINAGAPHVNSSACNNSHLPDVDPDEAFAYLTAANLVDGIWMAAMGYRLTIGHGFPRSEQQRNMLGTLTEIHFLPGKWSLQAVLTKIVGSEWYARRAPAISQSNTAYKLPPILNPWAAADPTLVSNPQPHQLFNGEGEEVNSFRVSTLLRLVAGSLGWKQQTPIPDGNYPSALALNLGQYTSPQNQGFTGVNFQSLLALESETGACDKTNRAASANDWIDALVAGIATFNAANSGAPITLAEAWMMLKDRLIQDPSIGTVLPSGLSSVAGAKTEQQALVAFLRKVFNDPALTLNASTDAASIAPALGAALRKACGDLVKLPQFVLTNITPKSYSDNNMPGPARLSVCLPGEPCNYAQVCDRWRQTLYNMGYNIACLDRSVVRLPWVYYPDDHNYAERMVVSGPPSGHDWSVLTRRSTEASAQLRLSSPVQPAQPVQLAQPGQLVQPAQPVQLVQPPQVGTATAAPPARPVPTASGPQFDLMQSVRINSREPLRGVSRLNQRLTMICPGGICGSAPGAASNIARCIENPRDNNCLALFPICDSRTQQGSNSCGALPVDFTDSGVLAVWVDGADVIEARNARLLRDQRWQPLQTGAKLSAGDMIYLPLAASLRLQYDNVAFGDTAMAEERVAGVTGHLLAITGPSASKLLERAPAPGALSPAALIRGVQSGAFESRAMTAKELERASASIARREISSPWTPRQIREMNSNHDALHRGIPRERRQ